MFLEFSQGSKYVNFKNYKIYKYTLLKNLKVYFCYFKCYRGFLTESFIFHFFFILICFWIFQRLLLSIVFFLWGYTCLIVVLWDMFSRNCTFAWVHHHRHHRDELSISRYQALSSVLCGCYWMSPMRGVFLISFLKLRELRQGGDVTCPRSPGKC